MSSESVNELKSYFVPQLSSFIPTFLVLLIGFSMKQEIDFFLYICAFRDFTRPKLLAFL